MPTIVTSGARLARHLRSAWDGGRQRQGLQAWESADILPWPAWLERLWTDAVYSQAAAAPVLLSADQEAFLWEEILAGSDLLNLSRAAGSVAAAWSLLHEWRLPRDPSLFAGSPDTEAFLGWSCLFESRCRDNGWISGAELPGRLAGILGSAALPLPETLHYAGFDELTPAQQALFACLAGAGCAVGESSLPESPAAPARVRIRCANWRQELEQAAAWCRRRLENTPGCPIGVIVADLPSVRDTAARVFDDALHPGSGFTARAHRAFHLSAGATLAADPLILTALSTLRLCVSGLSLAEAGVLFRSPYIAGAAAEASARASLDAGFRRRGFAAIDPGHLRSHPALEICRRLAAAHGSLPSAPRPPGDWARAFSTLLLRAGWPGDRTPSSAEYQAIGRFHRLLSDFAALDLVAGPVSAATALARLSRMAGEARFEPGDPGAPVQVLGMLEAAGSTFDHLWVAGLDDSAWPPRPRPNPFLPLALQRRLKLPHSSAEREWDYARRATERILASAPDVVFSYAAEEGEEQLRPSALILGAPEVTWPGNAGIVVRTLREPALSLEYLDDSTGPPLPPGSLQEGGTRVLQDQAACPFRAFANHRLRVRELEEPPVGFSPRDRGIFVHIALKLVWENLKTRAALASLNPIQRAFLAADCVRTALDEALERRGAGGMTRHRELEQSRLEHLVGQWLEFELTRPDFAFAGGEDGREIDIGGLRLKIRIDRIDRISGGDAVIDYKTGAVSKSAWDGDRPDQPQLPLYAVTHPAPVAAVWFGLVEARKPRLKGVSSGVADRVGEWRKVLEALAADFRSGHAPVSPKKPATCANCPLPALCRVAEAPAPVEDGDPEDEDE